jgi:tetratricopeptide (TPR) repeat protein
VAAEVIKRDVNGCPELEVIAAFLDRRLDDTDRAEVAGHLSSCESCYFAFSEAAQIQPVLAKVASTPSWWTNNRILWSSAAAGVAAAATVVLAITGTLPFGRSSAPELTTLVAAVGTDRTIEPRLTGGFAHGPLRGALRSSETTGMNLSPDVRIAAAEIEKTTGGQQSAGAKQARGIASLIVGDIDRAVATLEEAAAQSPSNARILNDLAAAYLVRGQRSGQSEDLSKALASVNRALNADRSLREAWFNRAYALERLSMTKESRDAWQAYLTIDDRSGWADEARAHLRAFTAQP